MNKDFWERVNKLEALACNTNAGPWWHGIGHPHEIYTENENWPIAAVESYNDAAYIAAANPAMIKEMIAELRRLEKEADWLAKRLAEFCDPEHDEQCCYLCREYCDRVKAHEWREAAHKAVKEM